MIFKETFMRDWAPMSMKIGLKVYNQDQPSFNHETSNKGDLFLEDIVIPDKETALSNS